MIALSSEPQQDCSYSGSRLPKDFKVRSPFARQLLFGITGHSLFPPFYLEGELLEERREFFGGFIDRALVLAFDHHAGEPFRA